ncbi:MAG: lipopolysaccharide biosynthesis protein, partial [Elusimicrobiota bacterium]
TLEYATATVWFVFYFPWPSVVDPALEELPLRGIFEEFSRFCRPLVLAGWAGIVYSFADRWLLQRYSGSTEQAYLSIAQQFSAVSLIAAVSFINILWKEAAAAHHQGDQELLGRLFLRSVRVLYFIATALTCFAIPFSREVFPRVLGPAYANCWPTFAVLALYPMHQSLGQITGAYFQATGRTRAYMVFVLALVAVSLPLAYWVLAPSAGALPGLGLGSKGLAVKMVLVQALMINLQGLYICRKAGWRWPLAYQLTAPAVLLALGAACLAAASAVVPNTSTAWVFAKLAFGFILYACAAGALLLRFPEFAGLEPGKIAQWARLGTDFARSLRGGSAT